MTNTYCCVYSVEPPGDGQWICPKHVEFFIENKVRMDPDLASRQST